MIGPYPVQPLIDRVVTQCPKARLVGSAADLDTALRTPPNTSPAVFLLTQERGGQEKYSGATAIQNVSVDVTVVVLVRNVAGTHGTAARGEADALIAELRAALVGWTPDEAFNALTFSAGRDDRYAAGWYAGQQIFKTDYRLRNEVRP
ncbi:MAG: hypothetical protein Q4G71_10015 [Pseudomonadota bacterium]|nr:hypothetical protein [Pseudomonadota bacterium]